MEEFPFYSCELLIVFVVMRPDILHRRVEIERCLDTGYRGDVFRDGEGRNENMLAVFPCRDCSLVEKIRFLHIFFAFEQISFDFFGKDSHQTWIEEHQVTIVKKP